MAQDCVRFVSMDFERYIFNRKNKANCKIQIVKMIPTQQLTRKSCSLKSQKVAHLNPKILLTYIDKSKKHTPSATKFPILPFLSVLRPTKLEISKNMHKSCR